NYEFSDFRLISAALPVLTRKVQVGDFREDLYYRISTIPIVVPPLRERGTDAVELSTMFAERVGKRLSGDAMAEIERCSWPGNIRQLKHCVELAGIAAKHDVIGGVEMAEAVSRSLGRGLEVRRPTAARTVAEAAYLRVASMLEAAGPDFEAGDFARAAGISKRSAQRHLAQLLGDGILIRCGAGRCTRYALAPRAE
ncbi:MAG: sigma 54-interacting transcriptional regulator, partial [Gemmatimonadaceae bacterium]